MGRTFYVGDAVMQALTGLNGMRQRNGQLAHEADDAGDRISTLFESDARRALHRCNHGSDNALSGRYIALRPIAITCSVTSWT